MLNSVQTGAEFGGLVNAEWIPCIADMINKPHRMYLTIRYQSLDFKELPVTRDTNKWRKRVSDSQFFLEEVQWRKICCLFFWERKRKNCICWDQKPSYRICNWACFHLIKHPVYQEFALHMINKHFIPLKRSMMPSDNSLLFLIKGFLDLKNTVFCRNVVEY